MSAQLYNTILIIGAAESGVGAAILAKHQGYDVFVTDAGKINPTYLKDLQEYHIPFEEGSHAQALVMQPTLIVKSPGVPDKAPIVQHFKAAGVPIWSEIEFAYRHKGASKIVAITGSNGKSTTTKLTWHIFAQSGFDAALVGNIGISFAKQVALAPKDWYIIEVSSFQLDGIDQFKPDIAVLLNITPDHLDRYHYDVQQYALSKWRITLNQDEKDLLIINSDDSTINTLLLTQHSKAHIYKMSLSKKLGVNSAYLTEEELMIQNNDDAMSISIHDLTLKGKHNYYNTMAAGISAMAAGIRKDKIRESLSSFRGLEHRLEHVLTLKGVDYINDSKATNVNSVWFALESMNQPTILILGGQDKGNDYSEIVELVKEKVKGIVCLGVDCTPIQTAFKDVVPIYATCQDMTEAVRICYEKAEAGDAVLLSPACASFDLFKNFEDRGEQFKQAVQSL